MADELATPINCRVTAMASGIAAEHGDAARAVLFYGSCLREAALDGLMLDFYLIVSDYRAAYARRALAAANRLIPPNVFPFAFNGLAAKYAVLSEADFARLCGAGTDDPSVWARFAQPARLAWVADAAVRARVEAAVVQAAPTLLARTWPTLDAPVDLADPLPIWRAGFALTYAAELRAERRGRAGSIVDADPERYRTFSAPALAAAGIKPGRAPAADTRAAALRRWARVQRQGKRLTLLRLAKASATYAGGIDYLAWKIDRHAGTAIAIRPWQRRWPILGAISLLPRLLRRGAVR